MSEHCFNICSHRKLLELQLERTSASDARMVRLSGNRKYVKRIC